MDECVKRTFTLDLNKSCGDAESNIKVRVQRPRSNLKTGLDEAGHALMAHANQNNKETFLGENSRHILCRLFLNFNILIL